MIRKLFWTIFVFPMALIGSFLFWVFGEMEFKRAFKAFDKLFSVGFHLRD